MLKPARTLSKAKKARKNSDQRVEDHFVDVNKMVQLGSVGQAWALEQTIAGNVAEILET
jgi:hypothetical protein